VAPMHRKKGKKTTTTHYSQPSTHPQPFLFILFPFPFPFASSRSAIQRLQTDGVVLTELANKPNPGHAIHTPGRLRPTEQPPPRKKAPRTRKSPPRKVVQVAPITELCDSSLVFGCFLAPSGESGFAAGWSALVAIFEMGVSVYLRVSVCARVCRRVSVSLCV